MLLLQPRSTLFPYTTLFRSQQHVDAFDLQIAQGRVVLERPVDEQPHVESQEPVHCRFSRCSKGPMTREFSRSEEHTSELQSQFHLVCRLLLEKKKKKQTRTL